MANLLKVSSAFGRAMETVNTAGMCTTIYPVLRASRTDGMSDRQLDNVVTAAAEGYAFPTNLDLDQPVGPLAPQSQARRCSQVG